MTGFYATRNRAKNLFTFAFELYSALWACFSLVMPSTGVALFTRARLTKIRVTRSAGVTYNAMLGVFGRRGEFAIVYRFVASNAKCQSVVNVKSDVRKLCQRLDMMGMDVAFLAAMLAGVTVALKNSLAPFGEIALVLAAPTVCCYAAFPYRGCFARFPFEHALLRAKSDAFVSGVELFAANIAGFHKWLSAVAPAFLGAPFSIRPVSSNFKRFTAYFARLGYAVSSPFRAMRRKTFNRAIPLCLIKRVKYTPAMFTRKVMESFGVKVMPNNVPVFWIRKCLTAAASTCIHIYIIAQHALSVKYVAVTIERFFALTGVAPVLLEAGPAQA